MMPPPGASLVDCAEASRLDAATSALASLSPLLLMEDASLLLWQALSPLAESRGAGDSSGLLAICGSGNNGGDALALLRHARFSGLRRVAAILTKEPSESGAIHAASLRALGLPLLSWPDDREACEAAIADAGIIVDGLAGTGLAGALREPAASLLARVNAAAGSGACRIASIDLPSGLSDSYRPAWPIARAAWTLSVEPRKACLYGPAVREFCGEIIGIEGVFPKDSPIGRRATLLEADALSVLSPLPASSAHKGSRGRIAVFAGSTGATGAAVLASKACLAAGAGVAALFASRETYPIVAPMLEAVMVKPEPKDASGIADRYDAMLIGPGWGRDRARRELLAGLLALGLPAILDADAIALFRELFDSGFRPSGPILMTPHPGEYSILAGEGMESFLSSPASSLSRTCGELGSVIVLKSHVSWIGSPDGELAVWDGLESGLGTAGSGDVLAGLCAGLLARAAAEGRGGTFRTACAAVIAHGLAGRAARSRMGWFEAGALVAEAASLLGRGARISP